MKYQSVIPNILVKSVDETVEFYTQILGFKEVMRTLNEDKRICVMVTINNNNLIFQEYKKNEEEYPEVKEELLPSLFSIHIKMVNIYKLYDKICNTCYLVKKLSSTLSGTKEFTIRDNNGILLTISGDIEKVIGYDNYFLPVDDYAKSKQFYADTLGFKLKFEFEDKGMIAFAVGEEEPAIILKNKQKFPSAKSAIWIEVRDVKTVYNKMKSKGVAFLTEPFRIKTGWAVEFIDPTGNILGFADYVI